jgi:hypothetical protein
MEVMMRSHFLLAAAFAALLSFSTPASAHCDGLDGPVVSAARKALDSGDPNPVLIWVQPKDEAEVRHAFAEAVAVRKLSPQAREMADRYFFETLVRVHRAGEGAPYTGLKPAGRDLGPAIPLADKAVATGSEAELASFVSKEAERGPREVRRASAQAQLPDRRPRSGSRIYRELCDLHPLRGRTSPGRGSGSHRSLRGRESSPGGTSRVRVGSERCVMTGAS